jgi:DNA invertase Pin-like site-specific DNA recombinase
MAWIVSPANLDDLRRIVTELTVRGVQIQFMKEGMLFTGEDTAMSKLLLSVMGAFAEFERSLLKERQREGIAIAKKAGVYKGRKPSLTAERVAQLSARISAGEKKGHSLASSASLAKRSISMCQSASQRLR